MELHKTDVSSINTSFIQINNAGVTDLQNSTGRLLSIILDAGRLPVRFGSIPYPDM